MCPINISQPKYSPVKYFWGLWTGHFFLNVKINHLLAQLFLITFLPRLSTWGVWHKQPAQSSDAAQIFPGSSSRHLQLWVEPRTWVPECLWVRLPSHLLVAPRPPAASHCEPHLAEALLASIARELSMLPAGFRNFLLLASSLLFVGLSAVPQSFSPSLR